MMVHELLESWSATTILAQPLDQRLVEEPAGSAPSSTIQSMGHDVRIARQSTLA